MSFLKHRFIYNRGQRKGVLFLLAIIVILQIIYKKYFIFYNNNAVYDIELTDLQNTIDSLKKNKKNSEIKKVFNPNFISDFKASKLGMTISEIDRLYAYRKQNKWINSANEFKEVTKISDSLFNKISPLFKFPDWILKRNQKKKAKN